MAPRANKICGPSAVRHLLEASRIYQRTVKDVVATIQGAIGEGLPVGWELEYAKLLIALTEVERALQWLAEQLQLARRDYGGSMKATSPIGRAREVAAWALSFTYAGFWARRWTYEGQGLRRTEPFCAL